MWAIVGAVCLLTVAFFIAVIALEIGVKLRTYSIRIVRTTNAGIIDFKASEPPFPYIHNLRINDVDVRDANGKRLALECADPCTDATGTLAGADASRAFDGNLATYSHDGSSQSNREPLFLHMVIRDMSIRHSSQIRSITVHTLQEPKHSIANATIELIEDGTTSVWSSVFKGVHDNYKFSPDIAAPRKSPSRFGFPFG